MSHPPSAPVGLLHPIKERLPDTVTLGLGKVGELLRKTGCRNSETESPELGNQMRLATMCLPIPYKQSQRMID
jgi:hypothetical protein